ncbi:tRNA 2-selenouridine(34) synthase MnmH [Fredinandcohnia quinoae]|uniref:tRNA 2-selenouridine(34) synthase MnmH n=1 Tax=Fredinandcohnia quinoae TaxID=2918902 RepID=A0AAW5E6X7_9BACI|nr:tRNA 2-selenouridine(34) synthase MnmH [Fredinandcohnia sp. SECRCQ15]MCH1626990.1 tRNA 2-selenouridine(34) synthase MnmH [Fredinandcohnia sp. SECRCQ15]
MFQDISVEQFLQKQKNDELVLVDVRSPSEFKEATIPGSVNIPFFTDEERAEIGTIYKQVSIDAAKERGLEIISVKLPDFIRSFQQIDGEKGIFCWRGGMRSKTSATLLALMGIHSYRLVGGIHAYRKWIVETLDDLGQEFLPEAYVLNGYTGTGKTMILNHLANEGYPVLDLEKMANHRGSVFGQIGLKPHNQKMFDIMFVQDALKYKQSPLVLFEAESKRIGRTVLPDFLLKKKDEGIQIFIKMPIEERVNHIIEDYRPWEHHKECMEAFDRIKKRIHTPIAAAIEASLENEDFQTAVRLLLEFYYDPRYKYTAVQHPEDRNIIIEAKNVDDAVQVIKGIIKEKLPSLK